MKTAQRIELTQACLFGGAIGDALGAPVEFLRWQQISEQFGNEGIRTLAPAYGDAGRITDDTQRMLFAAEGMMRCYVRIQERDIYDPVAVIHHALIRWAITQGEEPTFTKADRVTGLIGDPLLHVRRAPDDISLAALQQAPALSWKPHNVANGSDALTRVAPIGLFPWSDFLFHHRDRAFSVACETARLTHGHACAYLGAGVFAYLINGLLESTQPLAELVPQALAFMDSGAGIDFYIDDDDERASLQRSQAQIRFLLEAVLELHVQGSLPTPQGIESLGAGRTAQEALAIAVWCALAAKNYRQGVLWAVNHSGDSDGTGLLAGNLLGLRFGLEGFPPEWLEVLELRDWTDRLGHDLQWLPRVYLGKGHGEHDAELSWRYPPH